MGKLDNGIAIITGSDSGIGRAMAIAFAREGAEVVITWRSDERGALSTQAQIKEMRRRCITHPLDVSDEHSVTALFEAVEEHLGTPSILVNNAGLNVEADLINHASEDFDRVMKTNLYGPFFMMRAFVRRRVRAGGGGKIIDVTSVHESIPSPRHVAYGASKGGLLTMTRSLALELAAQRINVNAIAPGQIHTPMTQERLDDREQHAREMRQIPWGRPGEPEEVAALGVYLAGRESDYVTGQSFTIDGGLEMNWGQGA